MLSVTWGNMIPCTGSIEWIYIKVGVAAVDLGDRSCSDLSRCSSYYIKVVPVVTTTSEYV